MCKVDNDHYEYYHYMLYWGLHPKDQAWRMRSNQRCECKKPVKGDNEKEAY